MLMFIYLLYSKSSRRTILSMTVFTTEFMQPDFPTKGHHFVFRPVIALQSPLAHGTEPADKDLQCLEQSRGRVLRLGSIQGTDEGKGKQLMSQ